MIRICDEKLLRRSVPKSIVVLNAKPPLSHQPPPSLRSLPPSRSTAGQFARFEAVSMAPHPRFQPYDSRDVPIPTTRQPAAGTIRRAKTLTRPERGVAPAPLIKAPATLLPSPSGTTVVPESTSSSGWDAWVIFSRVVTFWCPGVILKSIGLKDKQTQQAWREKFALCFIAIVLGGVVGFATVGMQRVLCPSDNINDTSRFSRKGTVPNSVGIQGRLYTITPNTPIFPTANLFDLVKVPGQDITTLFTREAANFPACNGLRFRVAQDAPCNSQTACPLPSLIDPSTFSRLALQNQSMIVGYSWDQVAELQNYLVMDGAVLNMNPYMLLHPTAINGDSVDSVLRTLLRKQAGDSGKDGTRLFYNRDDTKSAVPCLVQRYYAGNIDKITPGCFASQLFLYAGLIVILGVVLVRFAMACIFNWFMSAKLAGPVDKYSLARNAISPAVLPEGANVSVDNRSGTAPWANAKKGPKMPPGKLLKTSNSSATLVGGDTASSTMTLSQIGAELFAVCLVTCYSEGEESLRTTLDSISQTSYSDKRKLLFVIADGMITGAGEKRSTPDICVGVLEADPRFGNPMPMGYIAVGAGAKKENRAMVYAGHYSELQSRSHEVSRVTKCIISCCRSTDANCDCGQVRYGS